MQMTTIKIYLAYWMENIFNLFGLEINMIGLLLASFAVLNAISLLYVTSLAACILMTRHTIRKLWPIFVLSFGSVLILEYLTLWVGMVDSKQQFPKIAKRPCHECWKNSALFFEHCKKCWLGIYLYLCFYDLWGGFLNSRNLSDLTSLTYISAKTTLSSSVWYGFHAIH